MQHFCPWIPHPFPRIAQTLERTKTAPCINKHQNDHLVQSKGVIERPGLKHILGTLFIYLFIYLSIYLNVTMIKKIGYTKIHIK